MQSYYQILFTLLIVTQLIACVEVKDKDKNESAPPPPAPVQELKLNTADQFFSERNYKVHLSEQYNQFTVELEINPLPTTPFMIQKRNLNTKQTDILELSEPQLMDSEVTPNTDYEYDIGYMTPKGFKSYQKIPVSIHQDIFVDGTRTLKDLNLTKPIEYIYRLYLTNNSTLLTLGQSQKLMVREFIADNAKIETFKKNQTAPAGVIGRSGGQIEIHAHTAEGLLNVIMRGEHGGQGLQGPSLPRQPQAMNGTDGYHEAQPENSGSMTAKTYYKCIVPATNGQNGVNGNKGQQGLTGFRGGSSGIFNFHSESDASTIQIRIEKEFGFGGIGGTGGEGQLGGLGGNKGQIAVRGIEARGTFMQKVGNLCPETYNGQDGHQGPPGDPGMNGPDGITETSCVQIGTRTMECR